MEDTPAISTSSNSPTEGLFNDLSKSADQPGAHKRRRTPTDDEDTENVERSKDNGIPKPKRIACVICRKRKLKCDGNKPSCATCARLGHSCAYDEVRRKSGPKRGYVKALEERLKQVETLLKTQEPAQKAPEISKTTFTINTTNPNLLQPVSTDYKLPNLAVNSDSWTFSADASPQPPLDELGFDTGLDMGMSMDGPHFTWEMIGLGLEEPLPTQKTIDELHQIYFTKCHPSLPMIHKYRYLAAMNLAPSQRPPVALRYAVWTLAASVADSYQSLTYHFYQRARKYLELDYLKGHGEHIMSVGHAQAHIILASYEFKSMDFPRAWMNTGSAVRLCQMMGLHRLDGASLDVKQCLRPPSDWTEGEERRRTFWMAFCEDRYASIGTGWPMAIDEKDIATNLPASDEAFDKSKEEATRTLQDSMCGSGASGLSAFGAVVLMACLFGRNLVHLHRPDEDDRDNDLNGEFWKRHRMMDNILLNTSLSLPAHLKLPNGLSNPNVIFVNMNIHTSAICLHQAAIYKADKNRLPASVSKESKLRCINAANEIANIMRMICHLDLSNTNPFMAFCLYVAARVFVQYLKSRPEDEQTADSLRFLLTAMNALKARNPLTESFLVQLDVDLISLRMRNSKFKDLVQGLANPESLHAQQFMNRGNTAGPDGRVDQCNFVKIVDDVDPPGTQWSNGNNLPAQKPGQEHHSGMQGVLPSFGQDGYPTKHLPSYGTGESYTADVSSSETTTTHSDRPTPTSSTSSNHDPSCIGNKFFAHTPEFPNLGSGGGPSSGLTLGSGMPDTPGGGILTGGTRSFETPLPSAWELGGQVTVPLTPVGEGLFQQLMGMGPMDMAWDGGA